MGSEMSCLVPSPCRALVEPRGCRHQAPGPRSARCVPSRSRAGSRRDGGQEDNDLTPAETWHVPSGLWAPSLSQGFSEWGAQPRSTGTPELAGPAALARFRPATPIADFDLEVLRFASAICQTNIKGPVCPSVRLSPGMAEAQTRPACWSGFAVVTLVSGPSLLWTLEVIPGPLVWGAVLSGAPHPRWAGLSVGLGERTEAGSLGGAVSAPREASARRKWPRGQSPRLADLGGSCVLRFTQCGASPAPWSIQALKSQLWNE